VVASRESPPACRLIKRAVITGLTATGIDVADLRVLPSPVTRHLLKNEGYDAGVHIGTSALDPEAVEIRFYEPPGIQIGPGLQNEIEKHFTRQELRRAAFDDVGSIGYPVRARESYAADLLASVDVEAVRRRSFRVVIDYGYSAASFVLPLVLAPLGVEAVSAHEFATERSERALALREAVGQAKRLVTAVRADLGAVFDRAAERLYLIDERGAEVPVDQALLLFVELIAASGRPGRLAFPVTVTSQVERLAGDRLEIVRTPASLADLTAAAASDGVVFGGALSGGYVFPDFLPAYDAVASLCKLLELLAPVDRPLSELVAGLPRPTLVHRQIPCPWALKGTVMRLLNERFADRDVDTLDGIKVFDGRGWMQVLPDADEPLLHLYAEGASDEDSRALEEELRDLVESILQSEGQGARSSG
jgi:mannose-1-phosphate guanylyltransferase / phosphomannomutase